MAPQFAPIYRLDTGMAEEYVGEDDIEFVEHDSKC